MLKKTSFNLKGKKQIHNNESGMVLVIAATFIMIISMVVVGVLSRNASQVLSAEYQSKRLIAEQLARGAWWKYQDALQRGVAVPGNYNLSINNYQYSVTFTDQGLIGPNGTRQIRVNVSF